MKKPEKKPKARKRTAPVKDLTARNAAKIKGGLNPQPEPPAPVIPKIPGPGVIDTNITNPIIRKY